LGAIAPIFLYYTGRKLNMPMIGAVAASVWGLLVLGWYWVKQNEFDGFSGIGAAYALSELAGLLVTQNPDWYLISPTISDWMMGAVFLGSMLASRPLIQRLSEQMAGLDAFPEEVRNSEYFRRLWLRLSLLWGGAYLLRGALNYVLLATTPMEVYLASRIMLGWPVTIGLIAVSFWYPKRYWQRVL